jgi:hypothetical protein
MLSHPPLKKMREEQKPRRKERKRKLMKETRCQEKGVLLDTSNDRGNKVGLIKLFAVQYPAQLARLHALAV